jgi:hypothetical protein
MKRMPSRKARDAAERRRIALERGLALGRKLARLEREQVTPEEANDRADEIADVAAQYEALFKEYPDVFPDPPVSPDALREHVAELREATAEARDADKEAEEASKEVDEARRKLDAAINEVARGGKVEKPN